MNGLIVDQAHWGTYIDLDDDMYFQFSFSGGFQFSFYGNNYDSVYINSNGNLTFTSGDSSYIPSFDQFKNEYPRIAAYWIDLVPGSYPGAVYYNQLDHGVVITWDHVRFYSRLDYINTFQIVLYDNGTIGMGYQSVDSTLPDWNNDYPLIGIAAGGGGASKIFKYNGSDNLDLQQTVLGPNGKLDNSQFFFVPESGDYSLYNVVGDVSY